MEHIMAYRHSSVVDPSTYDTHGLCDGIPLRCHKQPELEEMETLRCQEDWRKWVGPLGVYKGGLGPRWNFMAVTVPECLPERLGVLGYANELAFLHDDITDVVSVVSSPHCSEPHARGYSAIDPLTGYFRATPTTTT
jgi:hypothetical protein